MLARWFSDRRRAFPAACALTLALGPHAAPAIEPHQARARVVEVNADLVTLELEPHAVIDTKTSVDLLRESGGSTQMIGGYVVWQSAPPRIVLWRVAAPKTLPVGKEVLVQPAGWDSFEAAQNALTRAPGGARWATTPPGAAAPKAGAPATFATGRVVKAAPDAVTVRLDREDAFLPEPLRVELTSESGGLSFRIGAYSVQEARPPEFVLRPVDVSIAPSAGQTVSVSPVYWKVSDVPPTLAGDPKTPPSREVPSVAGGRPDGPPPGPSAPGTKAILGKVTRVQEQNVWISCPDSCRPAIGARVELRYVTTSGLQLDVGTWKVESIRPEGVYAVPVNALSRPRVGLEAVIR